MSQNLGTLRYFQTKLKELSMLCFVKDVQLDPNKIEDAAKELRYSYRPSIRKNTELVHISYKNRAL